MTQTPLDRPVQAPDDKQVRITVNTRPVTIVGREATGLQIKQAAIAAGLPVDLGFALMLEKENGREEPVADDQVVRVHHNIAFSLIAADDNS